MADFDSNPERNNPVNDDDGDNVGAAPESGDVQPQGDVQADPTVNMFEEHPQAEGGVDREPEPAPISNDVARE